MEPGAPGSAQPQGMPMMGGNMPQSAQYANPGAKPNGWSGDPSNSSNPGQAPWAIYQNAGKVPAGQMALNQQQQAQAAAQARKVLNPPNLLECS